MRKYFLGLCSLALLPLVSLCLAQGNRTGHSTDADHVVVTLEGTKWGPAPPALPPGAQMAVLAGNPSSEGPYTLRARLPAGYRVPPHWHPGDENVTVLRGTFVIGRGEKFDPTTGQELAAGAFVRMPKGMRHFAFAKTEAIIQVHGNGPFEIHYVNPADDPRKK